MSENTTYLSYKSNFPWSFKLFLVGALALLLWAWSSGWPPAILEVDIKQERINQALPIPRQGITIRQDFYARLDGLREIEVQFARYEADPSPPTLGGRGGRGELVFKLFDERGQLLREEAVDTGTISHNQIWVLRVYPQDESAGRRYTLEVTGNALTPFSLWGYKADMLAGELTVMGAETEARELRLITRYQLTAGAAIREVVKALRRDGALFGLALALIFMPGCLALLLAELAQSRNDFSRSRPQTTEVVIVLQKSSVPQKPALGPHPRPLSLGERGEQEDKTYLDSYTTLPRFNSIAKMSTKIGGADKRWDVAAWWGVALALGLSIWPLVWFWMTIIGLRWTAWGLWLVLGVGWCAVIGLWMMQGLREIRGEEGNEEAKGGNEGKGVAALAAREGEEGKEGTEGLAPSPPRPLAPSQKPRHPVTPSPHHLLLLLILFGALAVRLLAIRDLAFPLWVDSVRHGLITMVMAAKGQVLYDYAPLLPMIERFPYHFGYHTLPASLLMMTDWPLPRMLLSLGQLLNALMPLVIYSAVWLLTKRRDAGLLAAFLVAFPFLFPGYYATWGRFTQLTGMLIMPILVAMTWLLLREGEMVHPQGMISGRNEPRPLAPSPLRPLAVSPTRPLAPSPPRPWWLVGLLAAGLFLVHLRVFIYWLPFPVLVWLSSLLLRSHRLPSTLKLGAAAALGGLLVAPRVPYLLQGTSVKRLTYQIPGYNEFPIGYLTAGWEQYFIWLAGASLIMIIIAWLRKEAWASLPLWLGLWVAALFALLGGEYIGLPESWLVNLNSMYITLFLPLALVLGITLTRFWGLVDNLFKRIEQPILSRLLYLPLGALLTATLLFGIHYQITILNQQTILAYPDDLAALDWIKANTPPDARFAISSWLWLAGAWSGSDGGAWLFLLTGRESSTPPADYIYNPAFAQEIKEFNEKASTIENWSEPAAVEFLRQHDITHLFVGVKGGFLDPYALTRNPALRLLYQQDGAFVFEVMGE